ncbi:hypothetical protein GC169_03305 [bacterium]|nr:hypothetical protein [bacterium]
MSNIQLLEAAAKAYAVVCLSDGRLNEAEADRFARVMREQGGFETAGDADLADTWSAAIAAVSGAPDYTDALNRIAAEAVSREDRLVMMRAAQAAVIADGRLADQENTAVRALAAAFGLDPDAF